MVHGRLILTVLEGVVDVLMMAKFYWGLRMLTFRRIKVSDGLACEGRKKWQHPTVKYQERSSHPKPNDWDNFFHRKRLKIDKKKRYLLLVND
jgi:hypothetical protein